jgi:hypothetical protein
MTLRGFKITLGEGRESRESSLPFSKFVTELCSIAISEREENGGIVDGGG